MRFVTVRMPELYVLLLDRLVEEGLYSSRSEAIRVAVRDLLRREAFHGGLGERRGAGSGAVVVGGVVDG